MKKIKNENHELFSDLLSRFHDESEAKFLTYEEDALDFFFEMLDECVDNCYSTNGRLLKNRADWGHRRIIQFLDRLLYFKEDDELYLIIDIKMLEKTVMRFDHCPPLFLSTGLPHRLFSAKISKQLGL